MTPIVPRDVIIHILTVFTLRSLEFIPHCAAHLEPVTNPEQISAHLIKVAKAVFLYLL